MPLPRVVQLACQRQLLEAELAHGLQHLVARLVIGAGHLTQQALLHQCHDAVENREVPQLASATASAASRVNPPAKTASRRKSACSSGESRS